MTTHENRASFLFLLYELLYSFEVVSSAANPICFFDTEPNQQELHQQATRAIESSVHCEEKERRYRLP